MKYTLMTSHIMPSPFVSFDPISLYPDDLALSFASPLFSFFYFFFFFLYYYTDLLATFPNLVYIRAGEEAKEEKKGTLTHLGSHVAVHRTRSKNGMHMGIINPPIHTSILNLIQGVTACWSLVIGPVSSTLAFPPLKQQHAYSYAQPHPSPSSSSDG